MRLQLAEDENFEASQTAGQSDAGIVADSKVGN